MQGFFPSFFLIAPNGTATSSVFALCRTINKPNANIVTGKGQKKTRPVYFSDSRPMKLALARVLNTRRATIERLIWILGDHEYGGERAFVFAALLCNRLKLSDITH